MTPQSLDFSSEFPKYIPEDKDQRIVNTPYGKGIVIRTRKNNAVQQKSASMHEIELVGGMIDSREEVPSPTSKKPQMLYTPIKFPSVSPVVGSDVLTKWGRGKVKEIRDDDGKTHVVKLSSWRLANRSSVFCYVSASECEVVKPRRIYDMDVFEKVEHANELKQQATAKFKNKDYHGALELFAGAVDAVRYVQHGLNSTNELRADLIVVMITCSNNAALCSSKKEDWERAAKFGQNALVLIEALEEKGSESKIKKVLNGDGIGDSQLFGSWKVKSLLLIAKSQMEKHEKTNMANTLKKALGAISNYKKENDQMYKQLSTQEKDIRRLRLEFSKKTKVALKKEKQRARAMFGKDGQEKMDSEKGEGSTIQDTTTISITSSIANSSLKSQNPLQSSLESLPSPNISSNLPSVVISRDDMERKMKREMGKSLKKEAAATVEIEVATRLVDATEDEDEDDNHSDPTFFEEHIEALLILSGIFVGWFAVKMATKKK